MERLHSATLNMVQADRTTQTTVALASLGAALAITTCASNSDSNKSPPSPPDAISLNPAPESDSITAPRSPRDALLLKPLIGSPRVAEDGTGDFSAAQVQGLQEEVAALRQTLDDGLREPTETDASELVAEIQQLRTRLADAEHASKAAWKARADDWKAFEAERAATKLVLAEAAEIARKAKVASAAPTVENTDRKDDAAIDDQKVAHAVTLEEKQSPAGTTNATVTVEQINIAIREILSPVPVVVQGVLSPRDGAADELMLTQDCGITGERKSDDADATSSDQLILNDNVTPSQPRAKRRTRSWSRHKKGCWNDANTPSSRSQDLQAH